MDPDETLKQLRSLMTDLADRNPLAHDRAEELFRALDEWLSRGGFLPKDWSSKQ